jgi:hypothetical protein
LSLFPCPCSCCSSCNPKSSGNHQSKGEREGKNPQDYKPEEQGDMPQFRHCPLAKLYEDKNPKHHEEQQKDAAGILAAHCIPQKHGKKAI